MNTVTNGNGNGKIRGMIVYVSLAVSLMALAQPIFFAGSQNQKFEDHLEYLDKEVMALDLRQTKEEDKTEPEIQAMKETVFEDQQILAQQKEFILELRQQLGQRR